MAPQHLTRFAVVGAGAAGLFSIYVWTASGEISLRANDQLGQRSVRARRLFLRHAKNTRRASGAEKTKR